MGVLTADVDLPHLGTPTKLTVKAIAGGDTFYKGALVFADATLGLAQVLPAASDKFLGICAKQVVAAAGDDVEIDVDGIWAMLVSGIAATDVGDAVIMDVSGTLSDNHADVVGATGATVVVTDVLIGKLLGITTEDATAGWVMLHQGGGVANVLGWL